MRIRFPTVHPRDCFVIRTATEGWCGLLIPRRNFIISSDEQQWHDSGLHTCNNHGHMLVGSWLEQKRDAVLHLIHGSAGVNTPRMYSYHQKSWHCVDGFEKRLIQLGVQARQNYRLTAERSSTPRSNIVVDLMTFRPQVSRYQFSAMVQAWFAWAKSKMLLTVDYVKTCPAKHSLICVHRS